MKLLLSAKKRSGSWTGNYLITVDHENMSIHSKGYIGKLRTNFSGSKYLVYNNGENPTRYGGTANPRENLGVIEYVRLDIPEILTLIGISLVRT